MADFVADTHALVWHLTRDAKLSPVARAAFEGADRGENRIWLPGVTLVEIVYLAERQRLPTTLVAKVLDLVDPPSRNYPLAPLDAGVIRALSKLDRDKAPDMPDRIVAATAKQLGLPLLTKDSMLSALSAIKTVW